MKVLLFSFLLLCSLFSSASDLILAKQITLKSDSLGEDRNLLIKLPNQYYENSATYPVLYVLHAQWDMLSTLATLDLLADQIPNFIVIGVQSSGKELSPNKGKVTPFAEFISQEVVTYVNANYRIAPYSILSGHSNSGRFVLNYWLNNPAAFSSYFAFSPSVDDGYIVDMISQSDIESLKSKAPLAITIANEGEHMQQPFSNLTQKLSGLAKEKFVFKKFPEQTHRTTKHPSMQFALQSTFTNWQPSYEVKIAGLDSLKKHYTQLSKKYGFTVNVPNETLQRLTAHYAISKDDNAIEQLRKHITFTINQTPEGLDALFEIAEYLSANDYESAGERIFNKLCAQAKNVSQCTGKRAI